MNLKITTELLDDIVLVSAKGKITIGDGDVVLRDAIAELVGHGHSKILLALTDATTIDSSGILELTGAWARIHQAGGRVVLVKPSQKVRDVLTITQLITVFDVAESVKEGIAILRSTEKPAS
jgi:anti-anti-sigma factor